MWLQYVNLCLDVLCHFNTAIKAKLSRIALVYHPETPSFVLYVRR